MIAYLEGVLHSKSPEEAIVLAGGVGYRLAIPLGTFTALPETGCAVALLVHTHHREDDFSLFGFLTAGERDIFLSMLTVRGIGPKLARNIVSGMPAAQLERIIAAGDVAKLQAIPGIGLKTAQRIVLDLRGKLALEPEPVQPKRKEMSDVRRDALSALVNLGYRRKEAEEAVEQVDDEEGRAQLGNFIRAVLKRMGRGE